MSDRSEVPVGREGDLVAEFAAAELAAGRAVGAKRGRQPVAAARWTHDRGGHLGHGVGERRELGGRPLDLLDALLRFRLWGRGSGRDNRGMNLWAVRRCGLSRGQWLL